MLLINFSLSQLSSGRTKVVRPARYARRSVVVKAAAQGTLLSRLGRVLQEKARGDFERVFKGTGKTRERLGLVEELLTYWSLDDYEDTLEELEEALITADFGPKTALRVVDMIRDGIVAGKLKTGADIRKALKANIVDIVKAKGGASSLELGETKPGVVMVVGVNGGGKTTTIGKLAYRLQQEGARVMLAAGDTFRAAAVEQLATWAERAGAEMGPYEEGMRPDSVLRRAVTEAQAGDVDVVICDTSGRLHTNWNLMEELAKCKRQVGKKMQGAPHEVILVLDGTNGLNMLNQAREFNDAVGLTGLILTKLDGSARGGAVVSVIDALELPVKFVGVGETLEDLQPFDPEAFVDALFPDPA